MSCGCLSFTSGPYLGASVDCEAARRSRLRQLDLNLLRNQKSIVDINAEIPDSALDLGVAK